MSNASIEHLRRAIELGREASDNGEGAYGAVLVDDDGEVLIEARNTENADDDCTAHAEMNLVREASGKFPAEKLAGSTLYASCEPCAMCAGAIFWSGIGKVVFGLSHEKLYGMREESTDELRMGVREIFKNGRRTIEVDGPLIEDEAAELFE